MYQGVYNQNDFYSDHYLHEVLAKDLQELFDTWDGEDINPVKETTSLRTDYLRTLERYYKCRTLAERREAARPLLIQVIRALGYTENPSDWISDDEKRVVPLLSSFRKRGDSFDTILVIDLYPEENEERTLLSYELSEEQYGAEVSAEQKETGKSIEELVSSVLFHQQNPPRWIILMSIEETLLIDRSKWGEKRTLKLSLKEIFDYKQQANYRAWCALLYRENLCPGEGESLLDRLNDNSHKHAFAVSEDLKFSLREAIELIGNEAVVQLGADNILKRSVGEEALSKECLRFMYRLLFLFYIEARPELGYAPMNEDIYVKGYSLESLRDLAEGPEPAGEKDRNGTFLNSSIRMLFRLVVEGYGRSRDVNQSIHNTLIMAPLKSHLFDPKNTPMLEQVVFPNHVLHKVLELMSLSRPGRRKNARRGRISYVQLGINQLGAVYEGLLSYRGFIARDDLFEVKNKSENDNKSDLDPAIFVSRDELAEFDEDERVKTEDGEYTLHGKHSFIYRLTGRDRQKSASYYTPEVLTQCLVKYSLKELLKDKTADEILNLTVCEPAMGSAAFLNEAINQLSEAYLVLKQKESGVSIPHDDYLVEKQKVKSLIADRNVFGVDLNPVAVELGEVSLWLNTIFSGGFVPWFGLQLKNGNSLIGARRETLPLSSLLPKASAPWYTIKPERITNWKTPLAKNTSKIFHFLLPDPAMAEYKDSVVKNLVPGYIETIKKWQRGMLKTFSPGEGESLRELTAAADKLIIAWSRHLSDLRKETTDPLPVFGQQDGLEMQTDLAFKDTVVNAEVMSQGVKASSEYTRLKLVMDYWCALWFWPMKDAGLLPSREEWLMDLSLLLSNGRVDMTSDPQELFSRTMLEDRREEFVNELGIVNVPTLIEKNLRLQLVRKLAEEYKFFHWELEYADIFASKGGFDLVLGNPPWIKVEWNEGGLLGERQPLFEVRKLSASRMSTLREETFERFPGLIEEYLTEYEGSAGTQNYLNAMVNHPELKKIQTNLYKCFLPLSWRIGKGVQGFVHPEGVYDDPKGGGLRKEIYPRLRYHFQFQNEFSLFVGTNDHGRMRFGVHIYGIKKDIINFKSINNIYIPHTIDQSFAYSGNGTCFGIKNDQAQWDTRGHRSRIVIVDNQRLQLFAQLYDQEGTSDIEARLPSLHSDELISVLEKFVHFPMRLGDLHGEYFSLEMWHETNAQKDGTIMRQTCFPDSANQWVVSGPHFGVGNSYNKTPRKVCEANMHYDTLDLTELPDDYLPRANYLPACSPEEYEKRIPRVPWKENGRRKKVTEYYRLMFRRMFGASSERSLSGSIMPKETSHIHPVMSLTFKDKQSMLAFASNCYSIIFDFVLRTTGKSDLYESTLSQFPLVLNLNIDLRGIVLSVLGNQYKNLWDSLFKQEWFSQSWLKSDPRLSNSFFRNLTPEWNRNCALRTDYERRQALVEIDVLVARELKITLEELIAIYRIQFPVLQQNENDTWYDRKGRIIFTCSKGLTGVGLPRKKRIADRENNISYGRHTDGKNESDVLLGWEDVKDLKEGNTVTKTWMDDTLPGGPREKTVTYCAPFDRCDREEDYREVWGNLDRMERKSEY
jgi:hypothetical protein